MVLLFTSTLFSLSFSHTLCWLELIEATKETHRMRLSGLGDVATLEVRDEGMMGRWE